MMLRSELRSMTASARELRPHEARHAAYRDAPPQLFRPDDAPARRTSVKC